MPPIDWPLPNPGPNPGDDDESWSDSHSLSDPDDLDYEALAQDDAERRAFSDQDEQIDEQEEPDDHDHDLLGQIIISHDSQPIPTHTLENLIQLLRTAGGHNIVTTRSNISRPGWREAHAHTQSNPIYPVLKEPHPAGVALLLSGEFGRVRRKPHHPLHASNNLARLLANRQRLIRPTLREEIASDVIPNSSGTVVARYRSAAYSGQYSPDSSFYYTCCRDFRLHVYDTTFPIHSGPPCKYEDHESSMKLIKTVDAPADSWTITDSHLSPDNERMIWASVTPTVYMTSTTSTDTTQTPISFQDPDRSRGAYGWGFGNDGCGIWSCRFSADGQEIVAGGDGKIFVYDLMANRRTVKIDAHEDDVNSCCWADSNSGNILISASDDTFLKVWDRRSLGSNPEPSGVLIGHTEGITYVSPKGDGRYVISNGKDQKLRLWDLRKMRSNLEYEAEKNHIYGIPQFDYRQNYYGRPRHLTHPKDCSVMEYHGHRVLRTLIRCHFSPAETTGQQYIYSGSADGRIHIWSLDGRVVQVLDRKKTLPSAFDPSDPEPETLAMQNESVCVRDVSWHSQEPILMSAGWEGYRGGLGGSSIARHEWKGLLKKRGGVLPRGGLEDFVEKEEAEGRERTRMPGSLSDDPDDSDYVPEDEF